MKTYQMIINGDEVGHDLPLLEVSNPATGEVFATVPKGGKNEAAAAVDAAYAAFKGGRRCRLMSEVIYCGNGMT